jgi:dnd system-associated protein 4
MNEDVRIRPPAQYESVIDTLIEEAGFETKQSVLTFAAGVGWFIKKREALGKGGEGIRWQIFERNEDAAFVNALALAEDKSLQVLGREKGSQENVVGIFEEYATAGLRHIDEQCVNKPGDLLNNLLSLVTEARLTDSEPPRGLEGFTVADLKFLGGES